MTTRDDQIKLGAFLTATGEHVAAWRHPDVAADGGVNFEQYAEIVEVAERGKFDLMFLADSSGVTQKDLDTNGLSGRVAYFEPITLLSALAARTTHIGLVATATTTYTQPFTVARAYASLDHISGGRAGWNVVTSANPAEAFNFGLDAPLDAESRYARADEYLQVVLGLWNSWGDSAFVRNKQTGRFFDPAQVHVLGHEGEYYRVRGPLNIPRTPQGHPVVVQAGSSDPGVELAAKTAEIVFTAQTEISEAQAFYRKVKDRMAQYGRTEDDLKILPGFSPVIGRTKAEAEDKFAQVQGLIHPEIGLGLLSAMCSFDFSTYPLDGPMPPPADSLTAWSRHQVIYDAAQRDGLTLRETYMRSAAARGHHMVIGTPTDIADRMEEWFSTRAADGFNVMPQTLPGGLTDFVDMVVPELQKRGLYRTEYEGKTLRENLGLKRPAGPSANQA